MLHNIRQILVVVVGWKGTLETSSPTGSKQYRLSLEIAPKTCKMSENLPPPMGRGSVLVHPPGEVKLLIGNVTMKTI